MTIKKLIISEVEIVEMCGKEEDIGATSHHVPKYLEKCVNRLRNTNPKKFQAMCTMHLSFMLDLPNLEDLLNDSSNVSVATVDVKNSGKKPFLLTKRKAKPFFQNCSSLPLSDDYVSQVYQMVQYLGQPHNIVQEGLFRKTGQLSRQKELKSRLYANEPLYLDRGEFSAHDCASVLKSYLGDLMEPLLTERYYKAHCQVPGMMPANEGELTPAERKRKFHKQVKSVQLLFLLLRTINSAVLQLVLDLLHRVSLESQTKMTAENLGTLFAPHILCPRDITASELQSVSADITKSVAFMIQHAPILFQVPVDLARDIANYWKKMEEDPEMRPCSAASIGDSVLDGNMTFGIPLTRQDSSVAFNTVIQFVDREATERARTETDTETALAQLYAHVQTLPDSVKKKKLLKQFNRTNGGVATPGVDTSTTFLTNRSKTKGIYGSIRKRFCKSSKKPITNQSLNVSKESLFSSQSEEDENDCVDADEGIPLTPLRETILTPITAMFAKRKVVKVDRTFSDTPRSHTPKQVLIFENDGHQTTCIEGKVCIVDMNQTAPSALPAQKRKLSIDTSAASPSLKKPKTVEKIEAQLSPIPYRASITKQLTPKKLHPSGKVRLSVYHSPELPENDVESANCNDF